MKSLKYFLFIVCGLLLSSCGSDTVVDNNQSANIAGAWVWSKSVGGMTGNEVITPEKAGYTKSISFISANKCVLTEDKTVRQASYTLSKYNDPAYSWAYGLLTINYDDAAASPTKYYVISISSSTLVLTDYGADGYTHTYVKGS